MRRPLETAELLDDGQQRHDGDEAQNGGDDPADQNERRSRVLLDIFVTDLLCREAWHPAVQQPQKQQQRGIPSHQYAAHPRPAQRESEEEHRARQQRTIEPDVTRHRNLHVPISCGGPDWHTIASDVEIAAHRASLCWRSNVPAATFDGDFTCNTF